MITRRRKSKKQIKSIFENSIFKDIHNEQSLVQYLQENKNSYNDFMLTLIELKKHGQRPSPDEYHHIIPTCEGGPSEPWNLVPVSFGEHHLAHKLRFEVYGKTGDYVACLGRENFPENAKEIKTILSKLGHAAMKRMKVGFYSSETQRELGKRSGGIKTGPRELGYRTQVSQQKKEILSKALVFTHNELNLIGETVPGQFKRTGEIKDFLVNLMAKDCPVRELIANDKHFTTNINKILNSIVGKTKLSRSSYKGWSVTEKNKDNLQQSLLSENDGHRP